MDVSLRLTFRGRNLGPGFAAFARARLARFSLDGSVEADGERATIVVRGDPDLVDMLEVACLLGPADCLVEDAQAAPLEP